LSIWATFVRRRHYHRKVTPNQRGAIAEAAITKVAVELGVIVSRPVLDAPYDLVFDLSERLLRVQCK
jgi:PD-(D/E)XK endonuclease